MAKKIRKVRVLSTKQITPHLQRIVLGSEEFTDLTSDHIGSYVKVLIPKNGVADFNLKTACMRSYTIQNVNKSNGAITLDFVINMHQGPATNWAKVAKVGDELAIAGPGPKKLENYQHSHYVLLGDLTSVNAIKGYVQQLPINAKIDAFIHTPNKADIISLDSTRQVNWLITTTPEIEMANALSTLQQHEQPPIIFMALEAGLVRELKTLLTSKLAVPRTNIVSSGYWKKGLNSENYKLECQANTQTA
ncbi:MULTISPECIES: siderophore-interacting protein [unclassified Pseudoalteromonas]|uniref:siderophore-interacting protein n=1 Tax=unclassified Pseudoalteromonas TaxID=194690 RepID=UPI0011088570|nr:MULTISPECIES: siderophore-interacting protein [unclassified Pseudoalteromonas]TMN84633.1 siderophore-interacting protein [Pseudoalteromonas sp. S410]TMN91150.1 siderophore-interacting protein [Pseudoalteromonas sp. S408]TMN98029.1 siderophore-interacting protein [Pseudoalteromonas sp. S407]TMO01173.1 siderophore-interacting protein [Pseudoalteromonas sp. S409]TMO11718.1 siderophore-interacting protein [Pseudoalteromonas sp. S186]